MKRKIKVWNRTIFLIAATILAITIIGGYLYTTTTAQETEIPENKPTTPTDTTQPQEPETKEIQLKETQDWIKGTHQQTTNKNYLKLGETQKTTPKNRKELQTETYRIDNAQENIILASNGKIQSYNTELEKKDQYTFFEQGFTNIQTKNERIYATEIIFEERTYNETLHIIDIQNNGQLDHITSQELDKDISNFKPINNNNELFLTEFQNFTHIYEHQDNQIKQKETLELEADFYDQVIDMQDDKSYLVGQEFDKDEKTLFRIDHNSMSLENKTLIQDLTQDDYMTGIEKIGNEKFVLSTSNTVKIVERDYTGNQEYKYKTRDRQNFQTRNLQMKKENGNLAVATDEKIIQYGIEDMELQEKWYIQRPEDTTTKGITQINENIFTTHTDQSNSLSTLEEYEENYETFRYYSEGTYTSETIDLEQSRNINSGTIKLESNNQNTQVRIKSSENSDFQEAQEQTFDVEGNLQSLARLDLRGQYVKIELFLQSNTWETPEIEEVTLQAD